MVAGAWPNVEAVLRAEVLLALPLTAGLLIAVVLGREELTSEATRKGLEKHMALLRAILFVLFLPLVLLIISEVLEHFSLMAATEAEARFLEETSEVLEAALLLLIDLGVLGAWLLLLRIRRQG
ncbi:MAG: hypothetical protein D6733_02160 [Methanobacteriota archaeon]|nr:MAG: hypothetical protein D6733_02160 [Euryarchaeota archaeon]